MNNVFEPKTYRNVDVLTSEIVNNTVIFYLDGNVIFNMSASKLNGQKGYISSYMADVMDWESENDLDSEPYFHIDIETGFPNYCMFLELTHITTFSLQIYVKGTVIADVELENDEVDKLFFI